MDTPYTETLDKIYLEWSQFTKARTALEIELLRRLNALEEVVEDYVSDFKNGLGPDIKRLSSLYTTA